MGNGNRLPGIGTATCPNYALLVCPKAGVDNPRPSTCTLASAPVASTPCAEHRLVAKDKQITQTRPGIWLWYSDTGTTIGVYSPRTAISNR
jgi:hypothetical protein